MVSGFVELVKDFFRLIVDDLCIPPIIAHLLLSDLVCQVGVPQGLQVLGGRRFQFESFPGVC